ncbi:Mitochodrial transcription termination factor-related [Macleaya cordata]|uniref:Mitochodrial transcription termination factor-related n=1 Tax=Macleaya cordata TaxID=56857 RepID=A0A200R1E7_MACCD|nr:Mitochodrial transcription termination factor-related [Macleaya cordata]
MRSKANTFSKLCSFYIPLPLIYSSISFLPKTLTINFYLFSSSSTPSSSFASNNVLEKAVEVPKDSAEVFRRCGCSDLEISKIFLRQPSLCKSDLTVLTSKLNLLRGIGLTGSDLAKIINCRPRFLASRITQGLDERIDFLHSLFGSKEMLLKAIIRNPSLLTYDLHNHIKRCVSLYEEMGINREELVPLLISRPTLIPRTSLDDDKLDYIRRTGLSKDSKMYKYVVTLIAISRLQTIREKVANFEKFGFSTDEVMGLFGRSPMVLTLSVDKVQRNMTFVIGTMKLSSAIILHHPFLLYSNLESVLRPRFLLAEKIKMMDLHPQIKGSAMLRALRMAEFRFVKAFINCHSEDVKFDLMEFYSKAKGIKRLAETSKRIVNKGFPF